MVWLSNFYKCRKNPWVGFVLVVIFGPFGFLYHSWKTAFSVLFVVGPLWFLFLRHTSFDLIENPWAHYAALLVLAGFAALQIKAQHSELNQNMAKHAQNAKVIEVTLSLLPNEVERKAFTEYLAEHPTLVAKLLMNMELVAAVLFPEPPLVSPMHQHQDALTRWKIASLLTDYGTIQAKSGDFSGASISFLYSIIFFEDNPIAWGCMAELYMAWEDKIAARWAKKLQKYRLLKSPSEILNKSYSDPAYLAMLQTMKERMRLVIKVCSEHPEWRDSYSLKRALPYYQDM